MKICADFGGMTVAGKPCGRLVIDSRCRYHDNRAELERDAKKAIILQEFEKLPALDEACKVAGVDRSNVWKWRQADEDFDKAVEALSREAPSVQGRMVESSLFLRIIRGKASAGETIFWLCNHSRRQKDGRWKDVKTVETRSFRVDPSECTTEELQRIVNGEDPEAVLGERLKMN